MPSRKLLIYSCCYRNHILYLHIDLDNHHLRPISVEWKINGSNSLILQGTNVLIELGNRKIGDKNGVAIKKSHFITFAQQNERK